mmetsp:Transcript_16158/g.22563  ORF Transcript_16158/g.22563 Transcript_16158/m.22563 type:complete len:267 (+) Transcript_16158:48-848(+)
MAMLCVAVLGILAAPCLGIDPKRVHLVDMFPRKSLNASPNIVRNYIFRGNNPVEDGQFAFDKLLDTVRASASTECGVTLPEKFRVVDIDLENLSDPGQKTELDFWKNHPELGEVFSWPTLGTILDVKHTPFEKEVVRSGSWAVRGNADDLDSRMKMLNGMLKNITDVSTVFYVHCNAGCDRTGEFIGSYMMSYLGYNATTAMGEDCRQCGRCPNFYATNAMGFWCLTLQERKERTNLGNCKDFAGCKYLGDCNAHNPTHPANPCPH